MTTQEIKSAIASTISGQGNQVDLGGKLGGILNGLLDEIDAQSQTIASQAQAITELESKIDAQAGVTIDLSEFELASDDTDITSAIPVGYKLNPLDKIAYNEQIYFFNGGVSSLNAYLYFGYESGQFDGAESICLTCEGGIWYASLREL